MNPPISRLLSRRIGWWLSPAGKEHTYEKCTDNRRHRFCKPVCRKLLRKKGCQVYTLNRNTKVQPEGTTLIQADRHTPGDVLRQYHFDLVMDVTAYSASDVDILLDALGSFDDYVLISSSAVYPDSAPQPFRKCLQITGTASRTL